MAGLQNVLSAIAQIGAVASATAAATREATDERKKYNAAVEETKRIETTAGVSDASPNRDRSRDLGATTVTTTGLGGALSSTRGRS